MSFPIASRALLQSTFRDVDSDLADRMMRVIESTDRDALLEFSEPARDRDRECHTPPDLMVLQAHALNTMLDGHGIEQIGGNDDAHRHADYDCLDAGDLYSVTLVRDNSREANGTWLITTVADIRELGGRRL